MLGEIRAAHLNAQKQWCQHFQAGKWQPVFTEVWFSEPDLPRIWNHVFWNRSRIWFSGPILCTNWTIIFHSNWGNGRTPPGGPMRPPGGPKAPQVVRRAPQDPFVTPIPFIYIYTYISKLPINRKAAVTSIWYYIIYLIFRMCYVRDLVCVMCSC